MSRLLVDVGNSRLKALIQVGPGQAPGEPLGVPHQGDAAAALLALDLGSGSGDGVAEVWIAHVLDADHEAALADAVERRWSVAPSFARSSAQALGLRNAYSDPSRLGVDRWLALLAAWSEQRVTTLVVDAGTALTVDALDLFDGEGRHLGGLIAPGLVAARRAVLDATRFGAGLGPGPIEADFDAGPGIDTLACVRQGALLGALGAIDRARRWLARSPVRLLMTGGDAPALLPHLDGTWEHRPHLVLEGLARISHGGIEYGVARLGSDRMVPAEGVEPPTARLQGECSTN